MRVGVVFGGQSVEHEVSVITAQQVMAALEPGHEVIPIYVSKSGTWYSGDRLRDLAAFKDVDALLRDVARVTPVIDAARPGTLSVSRGGRGLFGRGEETIGVDVVLPLIHGSHGEDGSIAGLCELWSVAYAGCGIAAAAVSMDKVLAKRVFRTAGLPVLDDVVVSRRAWQAGRDAAVAEIESRFSYPVFVKPATLGSSIGVAAAAGRDELAEAAEVAFVYDSRLLVEPEQRDIIEINCAVLGRGDAVRASVCEQPVNSGVLTYSDKYAGGAKGGAKSGGAAKSGAGAKGAGMSSARRIIPAPIDAGLTERIRQTAMDAFRAIGAAGVARVDFLVRPDAGEVILNEINTIPGSLSFYLWEPAGLTFAALLDELLGLAVEAHRERQESTHSIDSWLLTAAAGGGSKS